MRTEIRRLDAGGVATAVDWARAEGWNPGLADAAAFGAADPEGYLGLFAGGQLVATISAVRYGDGFAFVGFYICRPDWRGKGLGLRLWNRALAGIEGIPTGLDGVVAQQHNYARSGFELAHRNIRFGGAVPGLPGDDDGLTGLAAGDAGALSAFEVDARLFPAPRPAFLRAWTASPGHRALGLYDGGGLAGYGVIRRCHVGHKIGPLFAPSQAAARRIVGGLVRDIAEGPVFLDVPETNPAAVELARALGFQPVFETARMYRGPAPDLDVARIFGITTFELG